MMLRMNQYRGGYRIVSLARRIETAKFMGEQEYEFVLQQGQELLFYPGEEKVFLEKEEAETLENIGEYSILEFQDYAAYVYYDACAVDNALFITNRCNSNCVMCPVSSTTRKNSTVEPVENLLKIASQIPTDAEHLTITGGEPFLLKKDIFRLFSYLKEHLNRTEYLLLTNGRVLADPEYFECFRETFPENGIVGIPIHGYDAVTHDGITRAKGSFQQTMTGLKRLMGTKIRVELRIVVSRLNLDFIQRMAEMIAKEFPGVYTVKFIGLEMLGNARMNRELVWVDYKTSFRAVQESIRYLVLHGINVGIYNYPLCCVDRSFWPLCERSITDYKIRYLPECDACRKKDICGGMFQGTYRWMEGIIEAIR